MGGPSGAPHACEPLRLGMGAYARKRRLQGNEHTRELVEVTTRRPTEEVPAYEVYGYGPCADAGCVEMSRASAARTGRILRHWSCWKTDMLLRTSREPAQGGLGY